MMGLKAVEIADRLGVSEGSGQPTVPQSAGEVGQSLPVWNKPAIVQEV